LKTGRRINATPRLAFPLAPTLSRRTHEKQGNETGKNGNEIAKKREPHHEQGLRRIRKAKAAKSVSRRALAAF
jgi:hypothetical protein